MWIIRIFWKCHYMRQNMRYTGFRKIRNRRCTCSPITGIFICDVLMLTERSQDSLHFVLFVMDNWYSCSLETLLRAREHHLPQCYLPPNIGELNVPCHNLSWYFYWFPPEGWKAELTLVGGYIWRWFTYVQTVARPSTNYLIVTQSKVEPPTSRSQVQCPNLHYQATYVRFIFCCYYF